MCAIDWQIIADLIQAIGSIGGLIALYFFIQNFEITESNFKRTTKINRFRT